MIKVPITQFGSTEECIVVLATYADGGTALQLQVAETLEPYATVSVYVEDHTDLLLPNQIIVKTYSENEGILESLVQQGILELTGYDAIVGRMKCPICKINFLLQITCEELVPIKRFKEELGSEDMDMENWRMWYNSERNRK